jgi:putative transposase
MFAADIRRRRVNQMLGFRHWRWHLDEMYVKLNGEMVYLWRAVEAEKIVTDGLRSYPAAMKELGNADRRELGRWLNNRCENAHLPFRRRERAMQRFRRLKSLQKFALVHASLHNHFNSERHLVNRQTYKERRSAALAEWQGLAA